MHVKDARVIGAKGMTLIRCSTRFLIPSILCMCAWLRNGIPGHHRCGVCTYAVVLVLVIVEQIRREVVFVRRVQKDDLVHVDAVVRWPPADDVAHRPRAPRPVCAPVCVAESSHPP